MPLLADYRWGNPTDRDKRGRGPELPRNQTKAAARGDGFQRIMVEVPGNRQAVIGLWQRRFKERSDKNDNSVSRCRCRGKRY